MPTNLKRQSPYQQLVQGIQDEMSKQYIHDHLKVKTIAAKSGLAYGTVANNLSRKTRFPWMQTILALSDALRVEFTVKHGKVMFSEADGIKRKTVTLRYKGKPILRVLEGRKQDANGRAAA
jgi:hypothetical protein